MKPEKTSILLKAGGMRHWFTPLHAVLILGLAVRIWSAAFRTIINPDGVQYIYQAGALFNQDWSGLLACKLPYLSPLPIAIAAAFTLCRDWVVAGQLVNVVFGWATLLPLYGILRRFFEERTAVLAVMCYALMPVLVEGSGNVIRDPMFWCLASLGMLLFIRQWDADAPAGRFRLDLAASMLIFLLATWSRIEGVVFLAAPCVYLLVARTDRKIQRLIFFLMPILIAGAAVLGIALTTGLDINATLRFGQVAHEATQFSSSFTALEAWIAELGEQHSGLYGEFLHRTREVLGLIPFLVILHNVLEGVFYPFALILFAGAFGMRRCCREHPRLRFFVWQMVAGLLVLYIHTLQTWFVSYRFLAVMILPGCVLMASGIDATLRYLHERRRVPVTKAAVGVAVALIVLGLPKNLKPEERDKAVYRQAARAMIEQGAADAPADASAGIAGYNRTRALDWILLYSRRKSGTLPCSVGLSHAVSPDYRRFVESLDQAGVRYLLYEERFWPHHILDLPAAPLQQDFRLLGQWQHPDSKRFMLFERSGS